MTTFNLIDLEMVRNHMSDTFSHRDGRTIPDGYTAMRAFAIDPVANAADRLVFYRRVRANMIGERILGSL